MSTGLQSSAAALTLFASCLLSPAYAENGGHRSHTENYAEQVTNDDRALRAPLGSVSVLWSSVDPQELAGDLKRGGFVLLFSWTPDSDLSSVVARTGARNNMGRLSPAERNDARKVGEALRGLGAPVGLVAASRHVRTREAAELVFGRKPTLSPELSDGAGLHAHLVAPPLGQNVALLAYRSALGGRELPEGVCAVYHFDAQGEPELVALLAPADWAALAPRR